VSELDESTELAAELVLESLEQDGEQKKAHRWHKFVAMSTLLMAMLTAVGALLAGITAEEALFERTEEIIEFTILEGDRVEVEVLKAKHEILTSLGEIPDETDIKKIQAYEAEIDELEITTANEDVVILSMMNSHLMFAIAVTLLSVGITMSGMSIIVEQKWLWIAGFVFAIAGAIGVGIGILTMVT